MPIPVATLLDRVKAAVDGEGSDYWTFDRDYKPAINDGIELIVGLINSIEGTTKFTDDFFKEIKYTSVFVPSDTSRIGFEQASTGYPFDVWTILSVMPQATVSPTFSATSGNVATYLPAIKFIESDYSAKRLNQEEWYINKKNPFAAGNSLQDMHCAELLEYAYLGFADYGVVTGERKEIEIRPSVVDTNVGVTCIIVPPKVTVTGDTIPFSMQYINLFAKATLNSLMQKAGDNTTLYQISVTDLSTIFSTIKR